MDIVAQKQDLGESLVKFAARVADGKATSKELAFMTEMANYRECGIEISAQNLAEIIATSRR